MTLSTGIEVGRRICVVGNGGAGKSTLARELARRLGLTYVSRDDLVWREGWVIIDRSLRLPVFDEATSGDGWTYDGHLRAGRP
jgi:ATPase subunit of ABC transporter with duplicated ATPase domains